MTMLDLKKSDNLEKIRLVCQDVNKKKTLCCENQPMTCVITKTDWRLISVA